MSDGQSDAGTETVFVPQDTRNPPEWEDRLSSDARSLVEEFGETAVRACLDFQITDVTHIRELISSIRNGALQGQAERASRSQLVEMLSIAVTQAGGVNRFARQSGVSNCLVSRTLSKQIEPAKAIANTLGYVECFEFIRPQ